MKRIVSILMAFVMVVALNVGVNIQTNADSNSWQAGAITAPANGKLIGAGYIDIKVDTSLAGATKFDVYFDGELSKTLQPGAGVQKCEVYTTKVSAHTAYVIATLSDNSTVQSQTVTFYVSKKGLAMGGDMSETVEMKKMNISWYYNWAIAPFNSIVDDGVDQVPMLWGIGEDNLAELKNLTDDSNYILGYNEPDIASQANMSAQEGADNWHYIKDTGKRTVSPAASNPNGPSSWLSSFLEMEDCDAVALHCYGGIIDVNRLTRAVDAMWETYHKPIWVTEVSIMGKKGTISDHSYENEEARAQIEEYVQKMAEEMDKRDYVERYAWFPYNINSANDIDGNDGCGATAMFDYETGKFTELGFIYARVGNPAGYQTTPLSEDDRYIYVEPEETTTEAPTTTAAEIPTTTQAPAIEPATTAAQVKKPAKVTLQGAKKKKKSVTLTWKKATNAKTYQVQCAQNKKFTKKVVTKTTSKVKYTVKKLIKKKTYYFRVRGVNGKTMGTWSNVKRVKI